MLLRRLQVGQLLDTQQQQRCRWLRQLQHLLLARAQRTDNAVSMMVDWRFARHMDMYAGVMYTQKQGGFTSGYVLTATNLNSPATVNTLNRVSAYDQAIGLRYQF